MRAISRKFEFQGALILDLVFGQHQEHAAIPRPVEVPFEMDIRKVLHPNGATNRMAIATASSRASAFVAFLLCQSGGRRTSRESSEGADYSLPLATGSVDPGSCVIPCGAVVATLPRIW